MSQKTEDEPTVAKFITFESSEKAGPQRRAQADTAWIIPEGQDQGDDPWKGTDGLLKPLMPPEHLVEIYRKSSEVPKNARARGQNVAGFGWELSPVIKFEDPKLTDKAKQFIFLDRIAQYRRAIVETVAAGPMKGEAPEAFRARLEAIQDDAPATPTPAEVEATVREWQQRAEMEHSLLTIKLRNFCYEYPLQELFKRTEINRGGLGFCAWEILRDASGSPVRAKLVEPLWIRATDTDRQPIPVPWLRETSDVTYEEIHVEKRFRRFLMKHNEAQTWFKEFGDPRVISNVSGEPYDDMEAFKKALDKKEEKNHARPATELILWSEYSPGAEPYGMPVWHGHSLDVETSRASKEYDYDELAHGKVPRGIMSVVDATIESTVIDRMKKFFREGGIGNRNRVALMEIATSKMTKIAGAGRAIFDFTDFSAAQHKDATHLKQKEGADEGVSQDFGNPPVLLGNARAIQNRSVAEVSQQVAEEQTYASLRGLWNHWINQSFIRPWGFRFWTFKLKAPRLQQAEVVGKLLDVLIKNHVITPDQARPIAAGLLGIELLGDAADWQRVPPKIAESGMAAQFLTPEDNPLTTEDESAGEVDEDAPPPDGQGQEDDLDSTTARGLLEQLGVIAADFADGPARKLRQRLGLERKQRPKIFEGDLHDVPDYEGWGVDD